MLTLYLTARDLIALAIAASSGLSLDQSLRKNGSGINSAAAKPLASISSCSVASEEIAFL
jgi:hypothetical protein